MRQIDPPLVRDDIIQQVRELLDEIEREKNLRILFACESGSRAWGFASADRDYDVRFIFNRPMREYLRLRPLKDAFDLPPVNEIDAAGWDIRKTAELLWRSNPPLMEWLDSPIIYHANPRVYGQLRELREQYFDPKKSVFHYLKLAAGVWRKYIEGVERPVRKKYLYVLRPLACIRFIELHRCQPPTRYEAVLAAIDWPDDAMAHVRQLVERKMCAEELAAEGADDVLNEYICKWLAAAEQVAHGLPVRQVSMQPLDEFIAQVIGNGRDIEAIKTSP